MAKVAKKKDEAPSMRMVVENGRLVPAFPFEAERLASYRNGTKVIVSFGHDKDRPLVRKWFAIIGWYLKNTELPWGDKDTASAAIKLALALVEPFKMPSGQWAQYPKSLSDIDDAELENKIREAQQLLYEITGVDQETMRQNGGSLGDEPFETTQPANDAGNETLADGAVPPPASEEGTGAGQAPSPTQPTGTGAADSEIASPSVAGTESGMEEAVEPSPTGEDSSNSPGDAGGPAPDDGGGADSPAAPPLTELSAEDRVWLKQGAKLMLASLPSPDPESYRVLVIQVKAVQAIAPKEISDAALNRMEAIRLHCKAVCKGEIDLDKALVARTALARLDEVDPAPVKVREA